MLYYKIKDQEEGGKCIAIRTSVYSGESGIAKG